MAKSGKCMNTGEKMNYYKTIEDGEHTGYIALHKGCVDNYIRALDEAELDHRTDYWGDRFWLEKDDPAEDWVRCEHCGK